MIGKLTWERVKSTFVLNWMLVINLDLYILAIPPPEYAIYMEVTLVICAWF